MVAVPCGVAIAFSTQPYSVEELGKYLASIWVIEQATFVAAAFWSSTQLPYKNENVLKSVTIDGTVCKRVNRCVQYPICVIFSQISVTISFTYFLGMRRRKGAGV
ncbi:hypothetical protein [Nostoc sp. PCC 7107]|uniref:hypothetical protein n=1 Tax=Nostoc sp. PCC 7107 TaxID=317936 RepID=UPI0005C8F969|nr:hypothetical protein [Nostoc sp. PCC 7107]